MVAAQAQLQHSQQFLAPQALQKQQQTKKSTKQSKQGAALVQRDMKLCARQEPSKDGRSSFAPVGVTMDFPRQEGSKRCGKSGADTSERSNLRKTRLCKFFPSGFCPNGSGCTFAHGEEELKQKPDLFRTEICHDFTTTGSCRFGETCNFAHSATELRGSSLQTTRDSSECGAFSGLFASAFSYPSEQVAAWPDDKEFAMEYQLRLELETMRQAAGDLNSKIGKLQGLLHGFAGRSGTATPLEFGGSSAGSSVTTAEGDVWPSQDHSTWSSMKMLPMMLPDAPVSTWTLSSWDQYSVVLSASCDEECIGLSF